MKQYQDKTVSQLIEIAKRHFHKWIRERDKDLPCINCGKFRTLQAGHFFPTSTYSAIRFHEYNVNGECLQCNYYNSQSHAYGYRVNLEKKIGKEAFEKLETLAGYWKRHTKKWDRFELIEIIEKAKSDLKKLEEKGWVKP